MTAPAEVRVSSQTGWYLYGVVDADAQPLISTAGVAGSIAAVTEGQVTALVSRVPLAEFDEEPVRARLEDPAWLEENARAHEAVLAEALRAGAVVPFRFLTIYRDQDELRRFLADREAELRDVLERVRGKVELGVKAFVDRGLLEQSIARVSDSIATLDAAIAAADPGRAYLLQRRRDQVARDEATRLALEAAEDAHSRLRAASDDAVANAVQSRELSGRDEEMVLNGAYLVAAGDTRVASELDALADRYGDAGVTFELTGPWPAYNFVPRDLEVR